MKELTLARFKLQLINQFFTGHFIWSALLVMGLGPSFAYKTAFIVFWYWFNNVFQIYPFKIWVLLYHSRLVGCPPMIGIYLSTPYPKGALWGWDPVTLEVTSTLETHCSVLRTNPSRFFSFLWHGALSCWKWPPEVKDTKCHRMRLLQYLVWLQHLDYLLLAPKATMYDK